MEIRYPDYYNSFRCLAGACPDSCCKEWAVVVDESSAARYTALPGPLGDRLRAAMEAEEGDTILSLTADKRCPMWREDGLCEIQGQLGHEALCDTCRAFPRLTHDYGDFIEYGLELSCPEAARMILSAKSFSLISHKQPGAVQPEYEPQDMAILLRSRSCILNFLACADYTPQEALAVLLIYGYAVQEELDGGEPAVLEPFAMLRQARSIAAPSQAEDILDFFQELEILTERWRIRLDTPQNGTWTEQFRALTAYFINRYWLQAISDYDLISRVKLAIISCITIKTLGGDLMQTAQLYSKEIENDADNTEALLDGCYTSPALADINLLGILLQNS